jgi:DNA replication protein DnaC
LVEVGQSASFGLVGVEFSLDAGELRGEEENWTHEEFLASCLDKEVSARAAHGGQARIRTARFPAHKTLEDFDFEHQRSARREVIAHLGALDFIEEKANALFLGPLGMATHCNSCDGCCRVRCG